MSIADRNLSKHQLIVGASVSFGLVVCMTVLVSEGVIRAPVAVAVGLAAFAVALLVLRSQSGGSDSFVTQRRLIVIYVVFGILGITKGVVSGWTVDDTIGLAVLVGLLTAFTVAFRKQKAAKSSEKSR